MGRMRPSWVVEQGRIVGTFDPEEEVLLEFTVPIADAEEFFRIGWSLKGLRHSGWIAMSTGHAVWSKREPDEAARHIVALIEEVIAITNGGYPDSRR